jgi:SAM-dependent methyltransferase
MAERTRQLEYSSIQPEMHNEAGRRTKAAKMLAILRHFLGSDPFSGARVVDLGCSTGFIADEFRRAGATTVGVDIDVSGLAEARSRFDETGFVCADGERLPLPDASVDIVVFNHIYEHVVDPDAVMSEVERVLTADGVVYLGLGNKWGIIEPHYGLPFLSWLPQGLADRYVSRSGRAGAYHERFRGERGLRAMTSGLTVWDYTDTVITEPERFSATDVVAGPLARLPAVAWRIGRPLMPTFIWLGTKSERRPAGSPPKVPPRVIGRVQGLSAPR